MIGVFDGGERERERERGAGVGFAFIVVGVFFRLQYWSKHGNRVKGTEKGLLKLCTVPKYCIIVRNATTTF